MSTTTTTNASMIKKPQVLWAQREDVLYVTIELADIKNEEVKLDEKVLHFSAIGGAAGDKYEVDLEFYGEVDPKVSSDFQPFCIIFTNFQESHHLKTGQHYAFVIQKKESGPYWPRLLKLSGKPSWLKTDFNKWKDEDEDEDEVEGGAGMPFGGAGMPFDLGGAGGLPSGLDMMNFSSNDFKDEEDDEGEENLESVTEAKGKNEGNFNKL